MKPMWKVSGYLTSVPSLARMRVSTSPSSSNSTANALLLPPAVLCRPKYFARKSRAAGTSLTVRLRWFSFIASAPSGGGSAGRGRVHSVNGGAEGVYRRQRPSVEGDPRHSRTGVPPGASRQKSKKKRGRKTGGGVPPAWWLGGRKGGPGGKRGRAPPRRRPAPGGPSARTPRTAAGA